MLQVRSAIYDGLETLLLFPRVGRRQEVSGIRRLVTKRYGYLIYYLHDEERREIIVLSVKHPSQSRA